MTTTQIDRLIARRERLTNRPGSYNKPAVDEIDAQLRDVPSGQDNRVDLLLGRSCATLPDRSTVRWSTDEQRAECKETAEAEAARLAAEKMSEFEAHMRMLCADSDIEAPDYPGMWK